MASDTKSTSAATAVPFEFAIAASFTAEPLAPVFQFWGAELNAPIKVRFAPYNQLIQTLLDPASVFGTNAHGANVLLVRVEDLADLSDPAGESAAADNASQLAEAIRDAHERFSAPVIFCLCPASPAVASRHGRLCRGIAHRIESMLDGVPGVQCLSATQIARWYPVERIYDAQADRLGRIPYTDLYFVALGTALVRLAHSLSAAPYKVIALDCDNTLWEGICGEDGPRGVVLDEARRRLHEFMLEQREAGMLLCLASKNNEADVLETFELNPEFPLQLRHFTAWRLNWESKAENLASLAAELSLGLDSFVFLDDNPRECGEVEDAAPEVLTLALPENASEIPVFLDHVWAFDHPVVTEEDRNRSAYYERARQFGRELRQAGDMRDFVRRLALEVRFAPVSDETLPRAAQMTQRTNQFNCTTVRRTEAEIRAMLDDGFEAYTVDVSDRFGKYGIVGLIIWRDEAGVREIDTFLLSCRALGRGVEHRMLAFAASDALRRGAGMVRIAAIPTAKNKPARQFLHDVAAHHERSIEAGSEYELPAAEFVNLEWQPAAASDLSAGERKRDVRPSTTRRFVEYARIARTRRTPDQILSAMRSGSEAAASGRMNGTERRLAAIWSDLLQRAEIRPEDNFYDLGGHSLLAVLLTLRIREEFGIELPIDDVYSAGLTLAELARKVEMYELARVSPEDYEAVLAEVEAMTDEEVTAALERESAEDRV